MEEAIQEAIKAGHLEEVKYDSRMWISPLFGKRKTDGTIRLLADLSELNKHLKHPEYWSAMGPNRGNFISLVGLAEANFFAKIDISNAFHTCPVDKASRHLLVVRFGDRLLQYKTCPQGLSTSALFWPLHLASGLNQLLGDAWKRWAIIYVDDIVVVGSTEEECSERTKTLLDALDTMDKKNLEEVRYAPGRDSRLHRIQF